MPISPAFTVSQSIVDTANLTFSDVSSGSATLTTRRIYILNSSGAYVVPTGTTTSYIVWPYSDASIEVTLPVDIAQSCNVTVQWYNGVTLVTELTQAVEWDLQQWLFAFGLLQTQTSQPRIVQDTQYWPDTWTFLTNLILSESATEDMADIYSAQSSLDSNEFIMSNSQNNF